MFEKNEMPQVPAKKSLLIPVLLGVLAVVVLLGGYLIIRGIYKAPLAPALNLPTATKSAAPDVAPDVAPTAAPVDTTVPVVAPACGQTGVMTILFMGSDTSFGNPPYGADAVRVFKVDFDTQKITSVSFSRDLVVPAVALNDPNHPQAPLGLIFYYARQATSGTTTQSNAAAARVMAQVMMEDFGLGLTNYVTLQMENVAVMIDEVGGVQMNVPADIMTEHNVYYSAGLQTLNGSRATEYVRFLNPGGESARTARQNAFIQALLARLTDVSIVPHIPALLTEYQNAVVTDLSPEQLVNLVCIAGNMPQGNLTFTALDSPGLVTNNVPNLDAVKNFLNLTLGE